MYGGAGFPHPHERRRGDQQGSVLSPVVREVPEADAGVSACSEAVQAIWRRHHSRDRALMGLAVLGWPVLAHDALKRLFPASHQCPIARRKRVWAV